MSAAGGSWVLVADWIALSTPQKRHLEREDAGQERRGGQTLNPTRVGSGRYFTPISAGQEKKRMRTVPLPAATLAASAALHCVSLLCGLVGREGGMSGAKLQHQHARQPGSRSLGCAQSGLDCGVNECPGCSTRSGIWADLGC